MTVLNEGMLKQTENYVLVCVDGFALGWGKYMQNGMLKNKILRRMAHAVITRYDWRNG